METDTRWEQRFSNYRKALAQLQKYLEKESLSDLERLGLIKAFEFTCELAWNTLKDYLLYQGITDIVGSRDTFRTAFRENLVEDGKGWMDMLQSRNRTSQTYNEETAKEIAGIVLQKYIPLFNALETKMNGRLTNE
jgi:nucleotidyltransferase substrate binding protein (TIGR01987 family)